MLLSVCLAIAIQKRFHLKKIIESVIRLLHITNFLYGGHKRTTIVKFAPLHFNQALVSSPVLIFSVKYSFYEYCKFL